MSYFAFITHKMVHKTLDCTYIADEPNSTPEKVPVEEIGIREPCRACFPGLIGPKPIRTICMECNQRRVMPCHHNGGVLVMLPSKFRQKMAWTWPERAIFCDVVWCGS